MGMGNRIRTVREAAGGVTVKECCANCAYCRHIDDEWVCINEESEGYGCETTFDDYCGEWEERNAD